MSPRPGASPLAGRRILLTRAPGAGAGLAERLESLGAEVLRLPAVAFESLVRSERVEGAIAALDDYEVVVFTSPNGVRFFDRALREAGRSPGEIRSRIAAVGPGTARSLLEIGLGPSVVAKDARAEGLAAELLGVVSRGTRILWVRPEAAREVLPEALRAAGAVVDGIAFYRTVKAPESPRAAEAVLRGDVDVAVFASPSALRNLLSAFEGREPEVRSALSKVPCVAIGEVTAAALRETGLAAAAVAETPTDEGIERAIVRAVAR